MDREFLCIIGIIFGICILMVGIVGGITMTIDYYSCKRQANLYQMEYTWGPMVGCNLKFNEKWIPMDRYRAFEGVSR